MKTYHLNEISSIQLDIKTPSVIYLKGDLGTGKTTLSKHIINKILKIKEDVISPTYTYYNKYITPRGEVVYHFDLYRLQKYDEFFAIGGEDIIDNNEGIILIEWPELIEKYYKADIEIFLSRTTNENEREIQIIKK